MLSKKITKQTDKLFNPQGHEVWQQHSLARGLRVTILKEIEDLNEVIITEHEALTIAKIAQVLGIGNPAYNPFSGGRAIGTKTMIQSSETIRRALS